MASSRHLVAAAALLSVLAFALPTPGSADDGGRGAGFFKTCQQCHGLSGEGDRALGAPAIAGLAPWYLEAQLKKFKSGARGSHPGDAEGMRMRPMSRTLETDADLEAVVAYVAALPARRPAPVLAGGDVARGRLLFAPCAACHGADAAGIQQLNGPPLNHASDWYLLTQIGKFKAGIRGTNPEDTTGALMRPMSLTLSDQQAMLDVIAYITTLPTP